MKNPKKNRTIIAIADEIRVALKREVIDVIAVGALLSEAKKQTIHGGWMLWLEREFSLSQRTAYRYETVYDFSRSNLPDVANLKITVSALYLMSDESFTPHEVAAIVKEAKKRWIGATEARAIVASVRAEHEKPLDVDPGDTPASAPEEPPAPPPPAPLPRDAYFIDEFTTAINMLMKLRTKPSAKFVNAIATADLQMMANFLNGIAAAQSKMKENSK